MADLMALTARIAAAYARSQRCTPQDLQTVIASIRAALEAAAAPPLQEAVPPPKPTPAVTPARSVHPDRLVCLEDGLSFRSLRRHLASAHRLTADEYRAKWGLRADYPMVAPEYAAQRSAASVEVWRERRAAAAKTTRRARMPAALPQAKSRRR
jgi:predicted transcriptional regulator